MQNEPLETVPSEALADEVVSTARQDAQDEGVRSRLAKEVADWSADRSHTSPTEAFAAPVVPAKRPARAAKRVAKPVVEAAPAVRKPFTMSYDGVSSRDYLEQTLVRRQF